MNRILTKKQIILLVSLLLAVLTATGLTLAWLAVKTGTLTNNFTPGVIEITMAKSGSGNSYSATVTNDGTKSNVPAYVRMAAVPTFQADSNGTTLIHYTKPTVSVTYDGWTLGADGFYYYGRALAVGETTTPITVTTTSSAPSGYAYTVEFASEAIQTDPESVRNSSWPEIPFGVDVTPAGFTKVSTLGAASDGYVSFDVANASSTQYIALGGLTHPTQNNNEYYRLYGANRANYPGSGTSTVRYESDTTAGGTLRFRAYADSIRLTAVPKAGMTVYAFSDYSFDVYTGTGTGRTLLTTVLGSSFVNNEVTIDLPAGAQEVMICLPWDMGFSSIQVAVAEDGYIAPPSARQGGKIGFYGSSITQGYSAKVENVSASASSLSYAMQLCMAMDADCVNFGFSGSAQAEKVVINDLCSMISGADLTAFVLDYDWNVNSASILANGSDTQYSHYEIYQKLRETLGPDVPIIILSRPFYGSGTAGISESAVYDCINVIRGTYETARANGDDAVAFIAGTSFFPQSEWSLCHCEKDVVHPSNLGHSYMAAKVKAALDQLLAGYTGSGELPSFYMVQTGANKFGYNDHNSDYSQMSVTNGTPTVESVVASDWPGMYFLDTNGDKYTWYLTYDEVKWVNEIKVLNTGTVTSTTVDDLNDVGIYCSNNGSAWTRISVTPKQNNGYWIFVFNQPVQAQYFMLHMENPTGRIHCNWRDKYCFAVYDPEGGSNDSAAPTASALPVLSTLNLTGVHTSGRTGVCYYYDNLLGRPNATYASVQGELYAQPTNQSTAEGMFRYNSGVSYETEVTFNTFTVFPKAGAKYGNYQYVEIYYWNGDVDVTKDPTTYWTKASIAGVVVSDANTANTYIKYTFDGSGMEECYTWVLSEMITAKHIMVNYVYDEGRAQQEGTIFQFLSFAGVGSAS